MEYKFTSANFQDEVLKSDIPVLVDFYADWCGPCKMMAPVVKAMAEKYEGKIKVGKLNIDDELGIAQEFRVVSIPTFIIFQEGEAVETYVGAMSANEFENKIKQYLIS